MQPMPFISLLRRAGAAGVLALGAAFAPAQTPPAAPPVSQFTLDNGLTLIVKPDRRAPTAVHMLWVRVGAMDEVDGTSGVAHLLEHLMFKGTDTLAPGEFSRRVAALGGRENAFTSRDYTGYYQQVPAARLADVMALEADRFAHNRYSDEEFAKELAVVKEERRLRVDDNPRALMAEQQMAATFAAAPYRRPVIGWMGDLDALTADDARAFFQRWYVPANAAVVVAGDVDPQAVLALARKTYGAIAARPVPARKPRPEPAQAGTRRIDVKAPAEQALVSLAFKVPRMDGLEPSPSNDDALALTVLAAVLDGYSGARLDRALTRGPHRVADSVSADNGLFGRGPQIFTLSGVPAAGKTAAEVEAALRAQVARVAREGVSEAELNRVKTQWVASEIYKRDSVMGQAQELGHLWIQGLPPDTSERLIARLRQISAAQVQAVARTYFGDDQLTAAILVPQPLPPGQPARPAPAGEIR
ncbi:MAG: insulinase family protein [Ottowia sp.]|nr:insulinase family protein [Ottowia sp.]